jgi:hypothetical protein
MSTNDAATALFKDAEDFHHIQSTGVAIILCGTEIRVSDGQTMRTMQFQSADKAKEAFAHAKNVMK